jgi:hypothetical protein
VDIVDPAPPTRPTVDAADHKRFAADTFSLRLSTNVSQVVFSLETVDANDREILVREATAVLSLQSLKVLQLLLTNAVAVLESQVGSIQLAPGKEEQLNAIGRNPEAASKKK